MDVTTYFYTGVLGMRLVATLMAGPMRHYFFEISEGNTVAFFEVPGMETFAEAPACGRPGDSARPHRVRPAGRAGTRGPARALKAAHCEITDVVDHGIMRSVYFHDPNGIVLEAACWIVDATRRQRFDPEVFLDPDPVPAVAELRVVGLTRTPETHLRVTFQSGRAAVGVGQADVVSDSNLPARIGILGAHAVGAGAGGKSVLAAPRADR